MRLPPDRASAPASRAAWMLALINTLTLYASMLYAKDHDAARAPRGSRAPQAGSATVDPEAFRRELLRRLNDARAAWRRDDSDAPFRRLLEPTYTDLGIGIGRLDGAPLYSILFAVPQSEAFAR